MGDGRDLRSPPDGRGRCTVTRQRHPVVVRRGKNFNVARRCIAFTGIARLFRTKRTWFVEFVGKGHRLWVLGTTNYSCVVGCDFVVPLRAKSDARTNKSTPLARRAFILLTNLYAFAAAITARAVNTSAIDERYVADATESDRTSCPAAAPAQAALTADVSEVRTPARALSTPDAR